MKLNKTANWFARFAAQEAPGSSQSLLPCPHCGGSNIVIEHASDMYLAQCEDCSVFGRTEEEATALWNRRTGRPSGSRDMLPCPHCGAEGEIQHAFDYFANCSEGCLEKGKTEAEAASLWNRRITVAAAAQNRDDSRNLAEKRGASGKAKLGADKLLAMWEEDKDGEYVMVNDDGSAHYVAHDTVMEDIPKVNGETFVGIREWMNKNSFWPNIWSVNDHGNVTLRGHKGQDLGGLV